MIERLLRMQTIDGPYLGPARALDAAPAAQARVAGQRFSLPAPSATPRPMELQSLGQQLHIQQAQKSVASQQQQMQRQAQNIAQSLQPTTLQALQGQHLNSVLHLSPQELLLLGLLRTQSEAQALSGHEQWVPNASAQLSFVHTPRQILHTLPRAKKLRLRGISFMTFRFQWEEDTPPEEEGVLE